MLVFDPPRLKNSAISHNTWGRWCRASVGAITAISVPNKGAVFIFPAIFVFIAIIASLFQSKTEEKTPPIIFFVIVFIIIAFITINFSKLKIQVYNDRLTLAYGLFRKSILFKDVDSLEIRDRDFLKTGGVGIRYDPFNKIHAWTVRFGRGILIRAKNQNFFLSTNTPERLKDIIETQLREARKFSKN